MSQRDIPSRLSSIRVPGNRNLVAGTKAPVSRTRRRSGSSLVAIGVLALVGWLTPAPTLAQPNWISLGLGGDFINTLAIDPTNPGTLYAGADPGGVFKSTDGGSNWTAINNGITDLGVFALALDPTTPTTLFAGTVGGAFKSTDGGLGWTVMNTGGSFIDALAIDPATPAILYAAALGGGVLKSADGGGSWAAINSGLDDLTVYALAIDPATPATLYAGTKSGVFKTTNGGLGWLAMSSGITSGYVSALAIDPADPATLYAGTNGGLFKSTNGGSAWTTVNNGLTNINIHALAIDPTATATLYAGAYPFAADPAGGVFMSTDGGGDWIALNSGLTSLYVRALVLDPTTPSTLYAGTASGVFVLRPPTGPGACTADVMTLCLNSGRFKVQVAWQALHLGTSGTGQAVPLTADTGYFWFFASSNVEFVIKVVDGTPVNGHFWVFYGALSDVQYSITVTDTRTGRSKTYFNPQDTLASVADTSAFPASTAPNQIDVLAVPAAAAAARAALAAPPIESAAKPQLAASCTADATTLCLSSDRFKIQVAWQALHLGTSGNGQAVPLTSDTGYFWFFKSSNVELIVKVVDGTPVNGQFWVFYGALSNVQYTITVTDTVTGAIVSYANPSDHLASRADTSAFGQLLETTSTVVSASAGGTLTLPSGSSIVFPPGFVASDRHVTLSLVSSLGALPPSGLVGSVGAGLVLSFSPPLVAVPPPARSSLAGSRAAATDVQFSINLGANAPVEAVDSAPMANFVDLQGKSQFLGVPGGYDPTQSTATGTMPLLRTSDVGTIQVSLAQLRPAVDLAPLPQPGAKIWDGSQWLDGTPGFDPTKRTLVLVHGMASKVEAAFGDCANGAGAAAEQIRKAGGYDQVVGFDYDWTMGLAANGKSLAAFLDSLAAAGLVNVDLEGHSEGVPVALSAACQSQIPIGNITMLGGPIMGTPAASVGVAVQAGSVAALATVLLNLYDQLQPPVGTLGGILNGQFAPDLQPGNTGALPTIRGCVADKMTHSTSNLGAAKLIAAAGYDSENSLDMGALGSMFKFLGLFGSQPFDGIVGETSALGIGSGLNITKLSPYSVSHTGLECDSNVIRDVGQQVAGGGGGCSYTLSPNQLFPATGGSGAVSVGAPTGCPWTEVVSPGNGWITITAVSGPSGNGTVSYSVAANPDPNQRSGTMTIAGLTFTVTQAGASSCTYATDATSQPFGSNGGPGSVNVTAPTACAWTAVVSSGNDWITITSVSSTSGDGTVDYSVATNPGTGQRQGTMTIAGIAFAVTQAGSTASAPFDGSYAGTLTYTGQCVEPSRSVSFTLGVAQSQITYSDEFGGMGSGSIMTSGAATFTGGQNAGCVFNGTFQVTGSSTVQASGTWSCLDGCTGPWSASKQ
jgi:photosystem II stability/assembly factor-like uncharacterized protein